MLPRTSIDPLNPQLSKIPLLHFPITIGVLETFFDPTDGGTKGIFGPAPESFGHFDDAFVFFGCEGSLLDYCGGGGTWSGVECGVLSE